MKVLLDTNAYTALRQGQELVAEQVRSSEEVLLSIVVVGELLFGFRNGSRYEENARALSSFLEDPNAANDIWIAAHALEANADLISSDPHFSHIDGLPP